MRDHLAPSGTTIVVDPDTVDKETTLRAAIGVACPRAAAYVLA